MKLKFVCVGAQKAGTSTLDSLLRRHSKNVELPKVKETKFFLKEQFNEYGKGFNYYFTHYFCNNNFDKIEIDPEYLYFEESAKKLYEINKELKVLIIVREPIARAISHYQMSVSRGYETLTFDKAIKEEANRIKDNFFNKNHFSYLDRGKYKNQIERYISLFGRDNVKVIKFEDFIVKQEVTLKSIATFAKITITESIGDIKENSANDPRSKIIRYMLYNDNIIKKLASLIIRNKFIKMKIGSYINKLNSGKKKQKVELTKELSLDLELYYQDDVTYLKQEFNIEY